MVREEGGINWFPRPAMAARDLEHVLKV